jgi:hypothetical protein
MSTIAKLAIKIAADMNDLLKGASNTIRILDSLDSIAKSAEKSDTVYVCLSREIKN